MTLVRSQDEINKFFPSEKPKKAKAGHDVYEPTRKFSRQAPNIQKESILMTELRAEGRHGCKTASTQKQDTLPMEDGDQLSSYSAKPSAKKKLKRSESPENSTSM